MMLQIFSIAREPPSNILVFDAGGWTPVNDVLYWEVLLITLRLRTTCCQYIIGRSKILRFVVLRISGRESRQGSGPEQRVTQFADAM
jgi:hypothetical protein